MSGKDKRRYLVDSNILIYHLNGEKVATDFIIKNKPYCFLSRITFIEVMSFELSPDAERKIFDFLSSFTIIDTSNIISLQAIKNRKVKKIKLPDNIILSTAQVYNMILVSRNVKDFQSYDIDILNPFES